MAQKEKKSYPMSPYPLFLQFPEPGSWDADLRRKMDDLDIADVSLPGPGLARAYGNAVFASSRLHHVLTDFAVAMTDAPVGTLHEKTSGALRFRILAAAESEDYAAIRPYLHGWDHFLGQQSIRYRNHIIHGQMWSQGGQDRIGRIEGGRLTELTEERLVWLTAGISRSFKLLNQIFWDILHTEYSGTDLVRVSPLHGFHTRQGGFVRDIRAHLDFFQSQIPLDTNITAS